MEQREDLVKKDYKMIVLFILPCVITLLVMYAYPVVRTFLMSFFSMPNITAPVGEWEFAGFGKYE